MPEPVTFSATIDRIEGEIAVLLINGEQVDFPASLLPDAREGITLIFTVAADERGTAALQSRVDDLVRDLATQDDGGDIEL